MNANSLVGGIVADVFTADTQAAPMALLAFLILTGQGLGAVIYGNFIFKSCGTHHGLNLGEWAIAAHGMYESNQV
jgi:hypothetical protein